MGAAGFRKHKVHMGLHQSILHALHRGVARFSEESVKLCIRSFRNGFHVGDLKNSLYSPCVYILHPNALLYSFRSEYYAASVSVTPC